MTEARKKQVKVSRRLGQGYFFLSEGKGSSENWLSHFICQLNLVKCSCGTNKVVVDRLRRLKTLKDAYEARNSRFRGSTPLFE